ncbi:MAG TPA: hypothetical protein H9822_04655 [Candidatus Yaniella excrementavium]|nr:hypothetical protein [Candidatus Yaniella excrementavium]
MRRTISAFTTVSAATLLAVVTTFLPSLGALTGPIVVSVLVVVFALTWPVLCTSAPRWGVSMILGVTGLAAVWTVSLLPAHAVFSSAPTELWLAPVGGAAALGILAMFIMQTFTLPGGVNRFMTTAMFSVGAVTVATAAGWALLLRNKYDVADGVLGAERITGLTWLMLTILAAVAAASLATLFKTRLRMRMVAIVVVATLVTVALQFLRPGPLSVPAVLAGIIAALTIALTESFADTHELPATARQHPASAVAVGTGTTIVSGMIGYFVLHVLPW